MTSIHKALCGTGYGRLIGKFDTLVLGCLIQLSGALSRQKDQTEHHRNTTQARCLHPWEIPHFRGHGCLYEIYNRTYPKIVVLEAPRIMGGLSDTGRPVSSDAELPQSQSPFSSSPCARLPFCSSDLRAALHSQTLLGKSTESFRAAADRCVLPRQTDRQGHMLQGDLKTLFITVPANRCSSGRKRALDAVIRKFNNHPFVIHTCIADFELA